MPSAIRAHRFSLKVTCCARRSPPCPRPLLPYSLPSGFERPRTKGISALSLVLCSLLSPSGPVFGARPGGSACAEETHGSGGAARSAEVGPGGRARQVENTRGAPQTHPGTTQTPPSELSDFDTSYFRICVFSLKEKAFEDNTEPAGRPLPCVPAGSVHGSAEGASRPHPARGGVCVPARAAGGTHGSRRGCKPPCLPPRSESG